MDDRVDDSVDRLAQRKRHGGVRVQNRPLREEKRAVNRVFALRIIIGKGKAYVKSISWENSTTIAFRTCLEIGNGLKERLLREESSHNP